eukprot:UN13393
MEKLRNQILILETCVTEKDVELESAREKIHTITTDYTEKENELARIMKEHKEKELEEQKKRESKALELLNEPEDAVLSTYLKSHTTPPEKSNNVAKKGEEEKELNET